MKIKYLPEVLDRCSKCVDRDGYRIELRTIYEGWGEQEIPDKYCPVCDTLYKYQKNIKE